MPLGRGVEGLTGKCPVSPALEGGVKGHNIEGKYLTGKPSPLGRAASLSPGLAS